LSSQDWEKLTLSQIGMIMENTLRDYNYGKIEVLIEKDVIDGLIDFYFNFESVKKDEVFNAIKGCVILVGKVTNKTSWKSRDMWIVKKGKPGTSISTKNCRIAIKIKDKKQRDNFIISNLHTIKKR